MEEKDIKKADRKEFEKLLQRVTDIFNGACGEGMDAHEWEEEWATARQIGRVMQAVQATFGDQLSEKVFKGFGLNFVHIEYFEQPLQAALWLFECGVRT